MTFPCIRFWVLGPVLGTVIPLALSLLVIRFGRRRSLVLPFVLLNVSLAGWNLDVLLLYLVKEAETALMIDRFGQMFVVTIPWFWVAFTAAFVGRPLSKKAHLLFGAWSGCLAGLAWTKWYFTFHPKHFFGFYGLAGSLYPAVILTFITAHLLSAGLLVRKLGRTSGSKARGQIRYALASSLVMGTIGFDNFFPLFGIIHYPVGNLAMVVYGGLMTLALVKHRFLDFTVIFKRRIAYSGVTSVVFFGSLLIAMLGGQFIGREGDDSGLMRVIVGLGLAAGIYPAVKWADGKFLKVVGGKGVDRRRLFHQAMEEWAAETDRDGLKSGFLSTLTTILPGAEALLIWEGDGEWPFWERVIPSNKAFFPAPGGGKNSWCIPLKTIERTMGILILRGSGKGWRIEELDLVTDLASLFVAAAERLNHRQHVRGMERFQRYLLDCIEIGLVLVRKTGEVLAVNRSGRIILEEINRGIEKIDFTSLPLGGTVVGKTGRSIRVLFSPVPSDKFTDLGVLMLEDISHQVQLEAKAKRLETLSALGRMGAMVAHELRTPLSTIKGSCRLLHSRLPRDKNGGEFLDLILQEVSRADRFIETCLRATSHPRALLRRQPFDPLIRRILESVQDRIEGQVCSHLTAGDGKVLLDEDLMRVIITNLAENAAQSYDEEDKMVQINSFQIEKDGRAMAVLEVQDKGRGVSPDRVKEMFQPFWTSRPNGTGLGLTVVANAVEAMNGELRTDSSVGEGTKISVLFPLEEKR